MKLQINMSGWISIIQWLALICFFRAKLLKSAKLRNMNWRVQCIPARIAVIQRILNVQVVPTGVTPDAQAVAVDLKSQLYQVVNKDFLCKKRGNYSLICF